VINTCNGFRYAMGSALLDENEPDKVKYRTQPYLLGPAEQYEMVGDVPNVVFPCAALHDVEEDKLAVYYGAADTVVAMAFGKLSEVIQFTKDNSL
jgi:beta-1,4-mannooligosaccharide/beta-1,4-mannosyl-N-acetylglucosamine phosphorylase